MPLLSRFILLAVAALLFTEPSVAKTPGVPQPTPQEAQNNPFLFINEKKATKAAPFENHTLANVQQIYHATASNPVVTVRLPSSAGTGYQWLIQDYPTQWVKVQKYYIVNHNPPGVVGGTQEEVWELRIAPDCFISPQTIGLKFVYQRAWEDNRDIQPLVITILTSV